MSWEQIEVTWQQLAASFQDKFKIEGKSGTKEALSGLLQAKYSYSKEEAENHLEEWRSSLPGEEPIATSTSGAPTY